MAARDEPAAAIPRSITSSSSILIPSKNSNNNFTSIKSTSIEEYEQVLRRQAANINPDETLHFEFVPNKASTSNPQYFLRVQLNASQYQNVLKTFKDDPAGLVVSQSFTSPSSIPNPTPWSRRCVTGKVVEANLPEDIDTETALERFFICTDFGDLIVHNVPAIIDKLEAASTAANVKLAAEAVAKAAAEAEVSKKATSANQTIGGIITRAKARAANAKLTANKTANSKTVPPTTQHFTLKLLDSYFTGPRLVYIYLDDYETHRLWDRLERCAPMKATPEELRRKLPSKVQSKVIIIYPGESGHQTELEQGFRTPPKSAGGSSGQLITDQTTAIPGSMSKEEIDSWKVNYFFDSFYDKSGEKVILPPPYPLEEINPLRMSLNGNDETANKNTFATVHTCLPSPRALELEYRLVTGALERRKFEYAEARSFTLARPLLQRLLHFRKGQTWDVYFERWKSHGPVISRQWASEDSANQPNSEGTDYGLKDFRLAHGTMRELFTASAPKSDLESLARSLAPAITRYSVLKLKYDEWTREVLHRNVLNDFILPFASWSNNNNNNKLTKAKTTSNSSSRETAEKVELSAFPPGQSIMSPLRWATSVRPVIRVFQFYVPELPEKKTAPSVSSFSSDNNQGKGSSSSLTSLTNGTPTSTSNSNNSKNSALSSGSEANSGNSALEPPVKRSKITSSSSVDSGNSNSVSVNSTRQEGSQNELHLVVALVMELPKRTPLYYFIPVSQPSHHIFIPEGGFALQYSGKWPRVVYPDGHPFAEVVRTLPYQYFLQRKED